MKNCGLCGQANIPKNVSVPAICWKCVLYFCHFPERAEALYNRIKDEYKKRLLKFMLPEEKESDLNERKSIRIGRSVVRKGPHRAIKPKSR